MNIDMSAMVDEVALMKLGEEYEPMNKGEIKQMLKNVAVAGGLMGAGAGLGHLTNYTIGKRVFPGNPGLRKGVLTAGGALLGLASSALLNRNLASMRRAKEEYARQRNT